MNILLKRFSLIAVIVLCFTSLTSAQLRYGPELSMNITRFHMKQDNILALDQAYGFKAGVNIESMFPGIGFGINTGVFYSMRGANLHLGTKTVWSADGFGDERAFLHYLEIPFHLRFKWTRMGGTEEIVAPFVFGGPTFGVLVGHSDNKAIEYPFGEVGLTAGAGVELLRNWQLSCSYTWGMTYAMKTVKLDNFSGRNRQLSVGITRFF